MCHFGTYQFEVMPLGLRNTPLTFQSMMDLILSGLPFVWVYMYNVEIFSNNMKEHQKYLKVHFETVYNHPIFETVVIDRAILHGLKQKIS